MDGTPQFFRSDRLTPTHLWSAVNEDMRLTLACMAGRLTSGRVLVNIVGPRDATSSGIFDDTQAAVTWAFEIERALMRDGWTKAE